MTLIKNNSKKLGDIIAAMFIFSSNSFSTILYISLRNFTIKIKTFKTLSLLLRHGRNDHYPRFRVTVHPTYRPKGEGVKRLLRNSSLQ